MPIHGYPGGKISATPPVITPTSAPGIWTLEKQAYYNAQGTWPVPQYPFSRSVRTRSSASAYFNRTPSGNATSTTLTVSAWVKRGTLGGTFIFIADGAASFTSNLYFNSSDQLVWSIGNQSSASYSVTTNAVYRDPSAWYHIVGVVDTTNATSTNRLLLYVNGVQVTSFSSSSYPTLNFSGGWTTSYPWRISSNSSAAPYYFDGYLTGINFIDGQALAPTSFGAFDATTGVWNPVAYTGTYGTNGFFLSFSNPTSTTTIAYDYSGNGNNFTANNISVTAGVTYDSMVDTTYNSGTDTGVGGSVRANYATLNPIANGTAAYVKAGNLQINPSDGNFQPSLSTIGVSSGKWYAECTVTNIGSGFMVGIGQLPSTLVATNYLGNTATSWGYYSDAAANSRLYNNSSYTSYGSAYTTGTVISIALDMDAGTLVFYRNGVGQGTAVTGLSGTYAIGASPAGAAGIADMNYGQRQFVYTAPSGYKALCTQNLPTPTISNGANYMAATTYTGTGNANGDTQTIANTINGISFQPDFVWTKDRTTSGSSTYDYHLLADSVRGAGNEMNSNTTAAEYAGNQISAFNSNGFSARRNTTYNQNNINGTTYVGWQWKGGGTAVSNTAGSITSSVSANTTAGFSVVTYTGNGTSGATIGHGLGATPSVVIVKRRDGGAGYSWYMQHASIGATKALFFDSTNAAATSSGYWNSTAPTSTVFSVGNDTSLNASGGTYVAYCWSPIAGYSAFGSYVGNGVVDGPFIYCGFRPRYVLVKVSTAAANWAVIDSSRDPYNVASLRLLPNSSGAESSFVDPTYDLVSNGFKLRTDNATENYSGQTIVYMAFAENPFTISRAR